MDHAGAGPRAPDSDLEDDELDEFDDELDEFDRLLLDSYALCSPQEKVLFLEFVSRFVRPPTAPATPGLREPLGSGGRSGTQLATRGNHPFRSSGRVVRGVESVGESGGGKSSGASRVSRRITRCARRSSAVGGSFQDTPGPPPSSQNSARDSDSNLSGRLTHVPFGGGSVSSSTGRGVLSFTRPPHKTTSPLSRRVLSFGRSSNGSSRETGDPKNKDFSSATAFLCTEEDSRSSSPPLEETDAPLRSLFSDLRRDMGAAGLGGSDGDGAAQNGDGARELVLERIERARQMRGVTPTRTRGEGTTTRTDRPSPGVVDGTIAAPEYSWGFEFLQ